jgi:class 3 adenylate cyclase
MSPGAAVKGLEWVANIDVRSLLPMIRVPTLVISSREDVCIPSENSRYLAEHIPGAKLVQRPGRDHFAWRGIEVPDLVEEFLTGARRVRETDRVLGTVLFTDIVGSTELAAKLIDQEWRTLLEEHNCIVRGEFDQFRGQLVDTTGDSTLGLFDGPGVAILCACSLRKRVRHLGIEIRTGIQAGEVELREDGIAGIAVHIGARVAALAGPNEVLVSSTVKDLTAGFGISFEDHGTYTLKGVPDEWAILKVVRALELKLHAEQENVKD